MKVLITGASGLIGRHTVDELLGQGHDVVTYQRSAPLVDVPHVAGDIGQDDDRLCRAARGCEAIVHLAGSGDVTASRSDPLAFANVQAMGTLRALEAARSANAAFILASTQRVYPMTPLLCQESDRLAPDSPYGYAKWVAELWCRMEAEQMGVPTTALRFFSVYGPGQQANGVSGVVSIFARAAFRNTPLAVMSRGKRDLTDARDAARSIALAVEKPMAGFRVLNVATGVGTTFKELAGMIIELAGSASPINLLPAADEGSDLVADVSRAKAELGFTASIQPREGIDAYLEWLRAHEDVHAS